MIKSVLAGIVGLVLLLTFFGTYYIVEPNEAVVLTRFGQIVSTEGPGLHFKAPFMHSAHFYKTEIQQVTPKESVNTYTVDNQEVDVHFTIFYRIPFERASYIHANVPDYRDRLFSMVLDRLKAEMGKVNVSAVAEARGELRTRILKTIQPEANNYGLEVVDFQLTNLDYTKSFREAVNAAAVQKANVESREYERQQAEKTAERAKVEAIGFANATREKAKGEADAQLLIAEAAAKAIKLRGEAEAAAIKAQADALGENPKLVELRKAERWDGKSQVWVPVNSFGASPIPLMQFPLK